MKALTIQQPWAWAVIYGGKTIENRTQVWSHRGELAIHAGARLSERGCNLVPDLLDATRPDLLSAYADTELVYGAVIGMVDVVDCHVAEDGCCDSPWAEDAYTEHGGKRRRDITHLVLENPRPLEVPVPCRGALGLWTLPEHVAIEVSP